MDSNNNLKIAFETIGCRFNQVETAEMEELFRSRNFEIVPFSSDANIYVINTCTVTKKSDYRCRQTIRRAIQKNREAFVIVTGCYSQIKPEDISSIKGVDMVLGNTEKSSIVEHFEGLTKKPDTAKIVVKDMEKNRGFNTRKIKGFSGRTSAYLKVQTGCNETCSFCIVAIARGAAISEKPENILMQARELSDAGFKEIVLTGVNLGSYGDDLSPSRELSDIVEMLTEIKGIERIRLSSINPTDISERLIEAMKASEKICKHLHIPLQSGDDEILKRMRRNYTSSFYRELIMRLKCEMPDIGIGADVLVGFPGEDEERFKNTYRLIKELPLSYLHVFTYSQREGTDAYKYDGQIPEYVKKERNLIIKNLGREKSNTFRQGFIGKICRVHVENSRDKETGLLKGYTDNYIPVLLQGRDELMNRLVDVRIAGISDDAVIGELSNSYK